MFKFATSDLWTNFSCNTKILFQFFRDQEISPIYWSWNTTKRSEHQKIRLRRTEPKRWSARSKPKRSGSEEVSYEENQTQKIWLTKGPQKTDNQRIDGQNHALKRSGRQRPAKKYPAQKRSLKDDVQNDRRWKSLVQEIHLAKDRLSYGSLVKIRVVTD